MSVPIIESSYSPPSFLLKNAHFQTIYSAFFRRVKRLTFTRERIPTTDHDFLDLDWHVSGSSKLAILTHGLEGSTRSRYIHALSRLLIRDGYDVLAWNFRGCSGEPNLLPSNYHSGKSEDLKTVIDHVISRDTYQSIALVGFSVGGNITLKFLGELGDQVPPQISRAVAISTPIDLAGCAEEMAKRSNYIYLKWFLRRLLKKMSIKKEIFPETLNTDGLKSIKKFQDYDERFTVPLNGFESPSDYYEKNSSLQFLSAIRRPTLILNGADDTFLSESCYPIKQAKENPQLFLEIPRHGGHVGFVSGLFRRTHWHERRIVEFLK